MTEVFLESHELMPEIGSTTEVYVAVLGQSSMDGAAKLANNLRAEGVNVELDFTERKLDKQIKTAVKKNIPYVVFVGDEEVKSENYKLKDVRTGDEESLSFERLVTRIKDQRRKSSVDSDELFD
jgi:histidyl-tRNA synthetase